MVGVVVELADSVEVGMRGILWSGLIKHVGLAALAAAVAMVAIEAPLSAGEPGVVPEINGASLSAGLGLLGAGVLWLRARRGSK
jgi:hypothetical protein